MSFTHVPVLPEETIEGLCIKPDGVYMDGTLGGAGHAEKIAARLTSGLLVGIDRDASAIAAAEERLLPYSERCKIVRGNFMEAPDILTSLYITGIDGALLDLGVSSHQLDTAERGFSYRHDARLDMRMDVRDALTAYDIVNEYTEQHLTDIFFAYGEERFAKRITKAIITARKTSPVETTAALSAIIEQAVPLKNRVTGGHPAKRVFQALRIEVNGELKRLEEALRAITGVLKPGGRFCVITFHSLEDRIVKHCFRSMVHPCNCPRDLPVCVCGKKPLVQPVTRKPILPGEAECAANSRAHSAKLRIVERTDIP